MLQKEIADKFFSYLETLDKYYGYKIRISESICYDARRLYDRHCTMTSYTEFMFTRIGSAISGGKIIFEGKYQHYEIGARELISFNQAGDKLELTELFNDTVYRKTELEFVNSFVSKYFEDSPVQWGLRGDPHLWTDMKIKTEDVSIPSGIMAFQYILEQLFTELTGEKPERGKRIYVPRYNLGGMSSGQISCNFWLEKAFPLIIERYNSDKEK